jgi:hypothetical protein
MMALIFSIPSATLKSMGDLTFESLVTTLNGRELGRTMIHALVNKQIGDQINVCLKSFLTLLGGCDK